jgi:hypothetical protein
LESLRSINYNGQNTLTLGILGNLGILGIFTEGFSFNKCPVWATFPGAVTGKTYVYGRA